MKIALSIGHSPKDGGAETYDKKYSEYSFWKHHLPLLQEELQQMGHQAPIVNRFDAGGTTPGHAAAACNSTGADLAIEFHFNSADSPAATGTETLYWESSPKGKLAAALVNDAMVKVLELKNRGLKPVNRHSARAVSYFAKTRMPAVLVEPAFAASNPQDNERLQNRVREFCVEVARAINECKP